MVKLACAVLWLLPYPYIGKKYIIPCGKFLHPAQYAAGAAIALYESTLPRLPENLGIPQKRCEWFFLANGILRRTRKTATPPGSMIHCSLTGGVASLNPWLIA